MNKKGMGTLAYAVAEGFAVALVLMLLLLALNELGRYLFVYT